MITFSNQYGLLNVHITSYRMPLPSCHYDPRGILSRITFHRPLESVIVLCPIHLDPCSNVQIGHVYVSMGLSANNVSSRFGRTRPGERTFFFRQLLQADDDMIWRRIRPRTRWDHGSTDIFEFFVFEDTNWTSFHIHVEALF